MALRLTLDTNTIFSAMLWHGNPRRVMDGIRTGAAQCATSPALLAELMDVLGRARFAGKIAASGSAIPDLVNDYARVARVVFPVDVPRVVPDDPDDDHVIACAVAANADLIVSGDGDLLRLGGYGRIRIVTATQALALVTNNP